MWVESLTLDNIKCFRQQQISFRRHGSARSGAEPYRWITLLGENGTGKSTALQALALLLAGPEAAKELAPRPVGWVRDPSRLGKIGTILHAEEGDGKHPGNDDKGSPNGKTGARTSFAFSYSVTGDAPVKVGKETYTEPALVEDSSRALSWLRANAFPSGTYGWVAAGYGPYRRISRARDIVLPGPTIETPTRASNFATVFDEDRALNTFERWMVYLDYRIVKDPRDDRARRMRDIGEGALGKVLPDNTHIHDVSPDGGIRFRADGRIVPSAGLSDAYRSVVALAGDLIWRLIQAYPDLDDPTHAPGVVLIDELDIHLHPSWQRLIAGWLREAFPRLQFVVATHSPLIAIGAGEDACTLRLETVEGESRITPVKDLSAYDADRALLSPAFGLTSTHSPDTDDKIRRYHELRRRIVVARPQATVSTLSPDEQEQRDYQSLSAQEQREYKGLERFMAEAQPIGGPPEPGSLEARIDAYLRSVLP